MSFRRARQLCRVPEEQTRSDRRRVSRCCPPRVRGAGYVGPGARHAPRLLNRPSRREGIPEISAGKHRGLVADMLTVSKRLARCRQYEQALQCGVDRPAAWRYRYPLSACGFEAVEASGGEGGRSRFRWRRWRSCRLPAWLHHVSPAAHPSTSQSELRVGVG